MGEKFPTPHANKVAASRFPLAIVYRRAITLTPITDLFASTKVFGLAAAALKPVVFVQLVGGWFSAKLVCLDWLAEMLAVRTRPALGNT